MKDVCKIRQWITQKFRVEFVKQFPNDKLEDVLTRAERIIQGAPVQLMAPTVSLCFIIVHNVVSFESHVGDLLGFCCVGGCVINGLLHNTAAIAMA